MKVNSSPAWFDQIKQTIKTWADKLNLTTPKIIEIASFFAVGFFLGFLIKRYSKYVFICALSLIAALFLLDNFEFVTIDWIKIREVTGISPNDTIGMLFRNYFEWIKNNLIAVISLFIGFIIGYKIGQNR